eukprot:CAMPEP_0206283138 /NCGR_PEP_ID=MMETSP0047_2-20121206/40060_1 /ASSEMBLY_ACC=CAM_ASM_000192 /TAXON_ID=195065 /ORGANISM="Chroomonas mesostigmatica_cf, Strain CCMP1168" /LENGTH=879 /DNA_ID=CAMNT_0053713463 /DNA_START=12 /DNA_END=2649 /DNA_ORIENTATION=-
MSVNAPPPADQGDVGVLVDGMDEGGGHSQDGDMHDEAPLNAVVEALSGLPQGGPVAIVSASHVTAMPQGGILPSAASVISQATYASSLSVANASRMQKPSTPRVHWSPEENANLLRLVHQHPPDSLDGERGNKVWAYISKQFNNGRSQSQCRDQYFRELDPALKQPWTDEEDRKLTACMHRFQNMNNCFQIIAKHFPGRSDVAIESRWYSVVSIKSDQIIKEMTENDWAFLGTTVMDMDTSGSHAGERRPWTSDEDELLRKGVEMHANSPLKWTEVAKLLKGRQPKQCRQRYFNKVDPTLTQKGWTDEEDNRIVAAQAKLGNRFAEIAKYLHGRSESLVSHRWHFVLSRKTQEILDRLTPADMAFLEDIDVDAIPEEKKERRQRLPWTPEEDERLVQLVQQHGQGNWPMIAHHLENRLPKQCRDRYVNKLDPNLKKGNWTEEEDKMIVAAHTHLRNKWHEMSKCIPGRSELAIKDRWYAVLQPKAEEIQKQLSDEDFSFLEAAQPPSRWRKYGSAAATIMPPRGGDGDVWEGGGDGSDQVKDGKDVSVVVRQPEYMPSDSHIERRQWSEDEDAQLLRLVQEFGQGNWTQVAKQLNGRLPKQCRQRYLNKVDPSLRKGGWTDEEDQKIVAAQSRLGGRFAEIAKYLEGRSETLVNHRWHKVLRQKAEGMLAQMTAQDFAFLDDAKVATPVKVGLKDDGMGGLIKDTPRLRAWTEDEDKKLLALVNQFGQGNWQLIAKNLHNRLPKQCRDRYVNKVDPTLKKGNWTEEEDRIIVAAQHKLGERWAAIGKFLDGRSESSIKTRWYSVLKARADKLLETLPPGGFDFLNLAPPSQRWKKGDRPTKRQKTETPLPVTCAADRGPHADGPRRRPLSARRTVGGWA